MATDSPVGIIGQAVAGDRLAIQTLLLRHHDHLVAVITTQQLGRLDGTLSAEDVCQEAYVTAIRSIGSFRGQTEDAFFAWLRTIAENKLTDAIRGLQAQKRRGQRCVVESPDPHASSMIALLDLLAMDERTPSQSVARHELVAAIANAVERLPEDYRDVVRLRYVQGLSVFDAARQMGRGEGAVRMLCSRALRRLAEEIGDLSRFMSHS